MVAKLPLVSFVIINLTRLTAGVCMKVSFESVENWIRLHHVVAHFFYPQRTEH